MKFISKVILLICFLLPLSLLAQVKILGRVVDAYNKPIKGVRIFIDGTYDETSTNSFGLFLLRTSEDGKQKVVAHLEGYLDQEKMITIGSKNLRVDFRFTQKMNLLRSVTITSERDALAKMERETKSFTATEIVTTVTDGNLLSAAKTLPGTQQVGESGELYVRGGSGNETKLFVDGMLVSNYLRTSSPNQSSSSRFPPNLFSGVNFNSGGYSALYGQALSSALILQTNDLPYQNSANLSFSPIFTGADCEIISRTGKSALNGSFTYFNFSPYLHTFKPSVGDQNFGEAPKSYEGYFRYIRKTSKRGLFKVFFNYGFSNLSFRKGDFDNPQLQSLYSINNSNFFSVVSGKEFYKSWQVDYGASWSRNYDRIHIDSLLTGSQLAGPIFLQRAELIQGKLVLKRELSAKVDFSLGAEAQFSDESFLKDGQSGVSLKDQFQSIFTEFKYTPIRKLYSTLGLRYEHSSILNRTDIAPRLLAIYAFNENNQISLSYGHFYQKPINNLLLFSKNLDFEKSIHYIASYQKRIKGRIIRGELYYKEYLNLVKISTALTNKGYGYASGAELFWRDKISFSRLEYWIAYSYLDTRRNYLSYPLSTTPSFATPHTVSITLKTLFPKPSIILSTTYSYATGRPYYNPNRSTNEFLSDLTPSYNNLSLNIAHTTKVLGAFTVLVFTVNNLLGFKQVYGYEYSSVNPQHRAEIGPFYNRFFFLGLFMSFGIDRSNQVIDNQL